jgi:class 3 adenylate cyclase
LRQDAFRLRREYQVDETGVPLQRARLLHLGDVVEKIDGELTGDGANIGSRFEAIANPSGIPCLHRARDAFAAVPMFAPVTGSKKYTLFMSNSKGRRSPSFGKSSGLTRVTA